MPVNLVRVEEHAVAGTDDLDLSAATLGEAVRAPGAKWTLLALRREPSVGVATGSM
jgi:hypothetical protein